MNKNLELFYIFLISAVSLIGYLFFSWDLFTIIFYYWLETGIAILFALIVILSTTSFVQLFSEQGENIEISLFKKLIFYSGYVSFYLFLHGMSLLFASIFIFVLFSPSVDENWIMPNSVLFETFKSALNFIYATSAIYVTRIIYEISSKSLQQNGLKEYQYNLYVRLFILGITLCLVYFLKEWFNISPVIAIFIFTLLRIVAELLRQKSLRYMPKPFIS